MRPLPHAPVNSPRQPSPSSFSPFAPPRRPSPVVGLLPRTYWATSPSSGEKALIGIRFSGGSPFLIAKFSWCKNLVSGCIMRRPCFCSLAGSRAPLLCPAHAFWPLNRRRVDPGAPLFPTVNRRNFNRVPRAVLYKIREPSAERFISHGFRMGNAPGTQGVRFPLGGRRLLRDLAPPFFSRLRLHAPRRRARRPEAFRCRFGLGFR